MGNHAGRALICLALSIPFLYLGEFAFGDTGPVVTAPGSVTGAEGQLLTLTVGVTEPDGDEVISLTAAPLPPGAMFEAGAANLEGAFAWTPAYDQAGTYSITITARSVSRAVPVSAQVPLDGFATIEILVSDTDRPPTLVTPLVVAGREGSPISFQVAASDPDGDPILSLTAAPLPEGSTFQAGAGNAVGTFSWTPSTGQGGTYLVTLSAQSASGPHPAGGTVPLEGTAVVEITVGLANVAPVIRPISDIVLSAGEIGDVGIQATDPDGTTVLLYSLVSAPAYVTRTGAVLSIRPALPDTGTADVAYSVSDGQAIATDEFRVTVTGMPPCAGVVTSPSLPFRVLVDASRDGGVWWSPQASGFNPALPHQGKMLADNLRARGIEVTELPRRNQATLPSVITPELLDDYDLVIRAAGREYSASELGAYSCYVAGGGRLVLLGEFVRQGQSDGLAAMFGLDLHGSSYGEGRMNRFVPHPVTAGVSFISYVGGSGLFGASATVTILGYLSSGTFVDPEGDNLHSLTDPAGMAAMGFAPYGDGRQLFVGDTNGILGVPQPFWDNLLGFMLDRRPPEFEPVQDMVVRAEEVAEQGIHATDPDGGTDLSFGRVDGPPYFTVLDMGATGLIRLTPSATDVDTRTAIVRVSDELLTARDTLQITVTPCAAFPAVTPTALEAVPYAQPRVLIADLDRDGSEDIVALNEGYRMLSVFLSRGSGEYGGRLDALTPEAIGRGAAVGDLDEDGNLDIVFSNSLEGGWVLFGNGDGTFRDGSVRFYDSFGLAALVVRDFNSDGHADVAGVNFYLGAVQVFLGRGDGSLQPPSSYPVVPSPISLAAGDFDQDGALDLAIGREANPSSEGGDLISILFGNPDGSFGRRADLVAGRRPRDVTLGDVNEDGYLDVVVANAQFGTPIVSVLLGDGTGAFAPRLDSAPGSKPAAEPVLLDFDHDGHLDIAGAAHTAGFGLTVLFGRGDGSFRCPSSFPVGFAASAVAAGSLDSDCRTDLVVGEGGLVQNHVFALLNRGVPGEPGCAPVVTVPPEADGEEGVQIVVAVSAADPDGDVLEGLRADLSALPLGHGAFFSANLDAGTGFLTWTPSFQDARPQPYTVRFDAFAGGQQGTAETKIHVIPVNRPPSADAAGPYASVVGGSVEFHGNASFDPDGDALRYGWDYGDGDTGVGATPIHQYREGGEFRVVLEVTDGVATDRDSTECSVADALTARAFVADQHRTIPLGAGSRASCFQLEPLGGSYRNDQMDLSRLTLISTGTGSVERIPVLSDKIVSTEDRDHNCVLEIPACFRREDLQLLLSSVQGRLDVPVSLEGFLVTGERVRAALSLTVVGLGASALLTPNPVRDTGMLVFRTTQEGPVSVRLFDARGRLVKALYEASHAPAGYHEITINPRLLEATLPSGTYFYRIDSADGTRVGKLVILR